ncbi:Putative class A beta-lactamase-like penicillin binding protein transpeptidase domain protein [Candidatus Trichorickettsia mobilis]|uniref:beta-lactamase n=1 Tax=Candidatus Trichorickettsia mobilis TaxID=1346319 RepID=A0ABZ0UUX4_9RICK|nr:class A beta-lactamase [Candidatus Trichorickettsia mobilis]WPY01453.1 Putative class A beta-lactamase-like penicillin binding protein transpeptidase domain protein [Candidatus Trichorickettsia mobilis]
MLKSLLLNITKLILVIILSCCVVILNAFAENNSSVSNKLRNIESNTEGRLGIFAINTENGHVIKYRADEIFPTQCTSKTIGVAAVLKKSMLDPSLLSQRITYSKKDLDLGVWNPITEKHLSEGMTVQELCSAAISLSDNTAMNLLLKPIGGIQGMNDFARSIGDSSFRQDNDWPAEAYSGGDGNLKDSSTPQAMVESFRKITIDKALDRPQRDLLTTWLINTQTGAARIRSSIPNGWIVGNKTGTGGAYGSTNDLAIVWPPKHAPILIGIYYTSNNEKAIKREDALSAVTKVLIKEFIAKDKKLKAL